MLRDSGSGEDSSAAVTGGEDSSATVAGDTSSRAARRRRMAIKRRSFAKAIRKRPRRIDFSADEIQEEKPTAGSLQEKEPSSNSKLDANPPPSESEPIQKSKFGVHPSPESGCFPRYGMTSVCGRRRDMEDAVSIRPDLGTEITGRRHFFGVYDGHGGSHVSMSCKARMHELVAEEMEALGSGLPTASQWTAVMERSFSRMDAEVATWSGDPGVPNCNCRTRMPTCTHVGSTAVVAVVSAEQIVVGNCGDSRAVLCRRGIAVPLSSDHKPDRPDELNRILAAGGQVIHWDGARVLGVLAMSRSIGDGYLKPYVIFEPEVTVTERTEEDECLVLASDGMWDAVTNEMACYIVRMCLQGSESGDDNLAEGDGVWRLGSDKACLDAAMLLTKLAIARGSSDNVSVIVVDLRRNL